MQRQGDREEKGGGGTGGLSGKAIDQIEESQLFGVLLEDVAEFPIEVGHVATELHDTQDLINVIPDLAAAEFS